MTHAPLIISISGIRGIIGASLTVDVVRRFTAAFALTLNPNNARVVVARDTRPSGVEYSAVVCETLSAAGCTVFECGVSTTPAAKLMVLELQADGAVILTASHNPSEWNGLKLVRADGIFLNATEAKKVESLFDSGDYRQTSGGSIEPIAADEVARIHTDRVLQQIDTHVVRQAGLRAAVDPCNGTGGVSLPGLLSQLSVETEFINTEPNGLFAHEPEPVAANLIDLEDAVIRSKADIGFAIDPDADRVALVGADGSALGEDLTLALAVAAVTGKRKGPVVTTLSTSQVVSDAAARNDCPVFLTPVGEVHVVEKMLSEKAVIGGEGNGGVILTEVDPGRDAAVGVAVVLEALASHGGSLHQLVDSLPEYAIEKRKVICNADQLERTVKGLRHRYSAAHAHPVSDGVKLYMERNLTCPWIHLRTSNTEPIVRIIAEAETIQEARALCDEAENLVATSL